MMPLQITNHISSSGDLLINNDTYNHKSTASLDLSTQAVTTVAACDWGSTATRLTRFVANIPILLLLSLWDRVGPWLGSFERQQISDLNCCYHPSSGREHLTD